MSSVILASASPRRQELLQLILPAFAVEASAAEDHLHLPETMTPEEEPEYLARLKACDIAAKHPGHLVIGSDTVVLASENGHEEALGKPVDSEDAKRMLRLLSGKRHYVVTGCAIALLPEDGGEMRIDSFRSRTAVDFYPLSEEEIDEYVATGDPMDKAGAYGIQTKGARLIKRVEGDYFTIVGLPVAELDRHLRRFRA
ncbi:MAG: septum formation protein Maf [Firmicutes bacterium]|nr:septum formation protein Maf [Bacillota bacterium]